MNKEQYLEKRNELMTHAQNLINEGKIDEANKTMDSIKELDVKFEDIAKATANMNALKDNIAVPVNVKNMFTGEGGVVDQTNIQTQLTPEQITEKENKEYRNAFFNHLMGRELTNDQSTVFDKMNATLTAGSTAVVIPTTTAAKIWRKVGELYPFYNDVTKLNIKGNYQLVFEDTSSNSGFYEESESTDDGEETFGTYLLSGCELSRCIPVSWKLKEMSIDDFEDYIIEKMAKKMGAGLAYGVMNGKGKKTPSTSEKDEPYGVITALGKEDSTPQIVEYTTAPTYADLTNLFSKIKSGYVKTVYANNAFIWKVLANVVNKNGTPYFIPDTSAGGVGRMFGAIVKEDDSVPDDGMVLADATQYLVNFNKEITLDTEDRKKARETDYIGYAIVDGSPVTNKAFAYLKKK